MPDHIDGADTVDHAKQALEYLDLAETLINGYQHLATSDLIAIAQVHATLAVLEIQHDRTH